MKKVVTEKEQLLILSLDAPVSANERAKLASLIQEDPSFRSLSDQYHTIRDMLKRKEADSFGPFFAERILHVVRQRAGNLDYQLFFFFKKYQVMILGVLVALLLANLFLSDNFTLKEIFGLEGETTEDIFSIDAYQDLNP